MANRGNTATRSNTQRGRTQPLPPLVQQIDAEIANIASHLQKLEAARNVLVTREPGVAQQQSRGRPRRFMRADSATTTNTTAPVKRGRGRPKGSKNKKTPATPAATNNNDNGSGTTEPTAEA